MSTKIIQFRDAYLEVTTRGGSNIIFDLLSFRIQASINSIPTAQINVPLGGTTTGGGPSFTVDDLLGANIKLWLSYYTEFEYPSNPQGVSLAGRASAGDYNNLLMFEGIINSVAERDSVSTSTLTLTCTHRLAWLTFTSLIAPNLPPNVSWELVQIQRVMGEKPTFIQFLPDNPMVDFARETLIGSLERLLTDVDKYAPDLLKCEGVNVTYGTQQQDVLTLLQDSKKFNPQLDFQSAFASYSQNISEFFTRFPMEKVYTKSLWGVLMQILPSFYLQICPLSSIFVIEPIDTFTQTSNLVWVQDEDIVLVDRQREMNMRSRGVLARVRPYNPIVPSNLPSFVCYVEQGATGTLAQVRLPAWLRYLPYSNLQPPRVLAKPKQKQVSQPNIPSWGEIARFLYLRQLFEQNTLTISLPFNHIYRPGMNLGIKGNSRWLDGLRGRVKSVIWDWNLNNDSPNASTTLQLDSVHYDQGSKYVAPNPLFTTDQYTNLQIYAA